MKLKIFLHTVKKYGVINITPEVDIAKGENNGRWNYYPCWIFPE